MKKIALEEHFNAPVFSDKLPDLFNPDVLREIEEKLPEFNEIRLKAMDAGGVDITVLSQTSPGVHQLTNTLEAIDASQSCNNFLAEQIRQNPTR